MLSTLHSELLLWEETGLSSLWNQVLLLSQFMQQTINLWEPFLPGNMPCWALQAMPLVSYSCKDVSLRQRIPSITFSKGKGKMHRSNPLVSLEMQQTSCLWPLLPITMPLRKVQSLSQAGEAELSVWKVRERD